MNRNAFGGWLRPDSLVDYTSGPGGSLNLLGYYTNFVTSMNYVIKCKTV